MKHSIYTAIAILIIALFLPYCSGKNNNKPPKTYDAGIALAVEEDILKAAIERRLGVLENIVFKPTEPMKKQMVEPIRASDAINQ